MKIRKLGLLVITLMSVFTIAACDDSMEGEEGFGGFVEDGGAGEGDGFYNGNTNSGAGGTYGSDGDGNFYIDTGNGGYANF